MRGLHVSVFQLCYIVASEWTRKGKNQTGSFIPIILLSYPKYNRREEKKEPGKRINEWKEGEWKGKKKEAGNKRSFLDDGIVNGKHNQEQNKRVE